MHLLNLKSPVLILTKEEGYVRSDTILSSSMSSKIGETDQEEVIKVDLHHIWTTDGREISFSYRPTIRVRADWIATSQSVREDEVSVIKRG